MATNIYVNGTSLESVVECCDKNNTPILDGLGLTLKQYSYIANGSEFDNWVFIIGSTGNTDVADHGGLWGKFISTKLFYNNGYEVSELQFAEKGTAPIPYRPSDKACSNWGKTRYWGEQTFYLSYNSSTGYIRKSPDGTSSWVDLTILGKRKVIILDMCAAGGGGANGKADLILGHNGGGGGSGGSYACILINFEKYTSSIKIVIGKHGNAAPNENWQGGTNGSTADPSYFTAGSYTVTLGGGKGGYGESGSGRSGGEVSTSGSTPNGIKLLSTRHGGNSGNGANGSASIAGDSWEDYMWEGIHGNNIIKNIDIEAAELRGVSSPSRNVSGYTHSGGGGGPSVLGCRYGTNSANSVGYGWGGYGSEAQGWPGVYYGVSGNGGSGVCIIH